MQSTHRLSIILLLHLAFMTGAAGGCAHDTRPQRRDGSVASGDGGTYRDSGARDGGSSAFDGQICAKGSDELVPRPVDIIIAIDESASMGQETAEVRENINSHLTDILEESGIDYQVILIHSSICVDPPLGNAADCLADNPPRLVRVPHFVNSSDALTIILKTFEGYKKAANTCNFTYLPEMEWGNKLRPKAWKVFLVISDDDPSTFDCQTATDICETNCSGCANDCAGWCPMFQCPTYADHPAAWGGSTFPEELANLPGEQFGYLQKRQWVFHAIVGVDQPYGPGDPVTAIDNICNFSGNTAMTSGVEYQKLAVLTGGLRHPSCSADYSPVFDEIAGTIVPLVCSYNVESTSVGEIDPNKTNVTFDPMDGTGEVTIPMDDSTPCDDGADGWQWNDDYTIITLCGGACDRVKATAQGRVSIVVGCDTVVK